MTGTIYLSRSLNVLHLPCYICIGILTALLISQQLYHQKIQRGLLDKILENNGLTPMTDFEEKIEELAKPEKKPEQPVVRFNIPNMPVFPKKDSK